MTQAPLVHVVDDNPEIRESLTLLLNSVAIDVATYASADEFLARFRAQPNRSACLLLDVRMPGMGGMALLERLRDSSPSLPTIIVTGHGDIDMAVRAMKLGARDFITKPFGSQDLLDRVQDALRRGREPAESGVSLEEAAARWETLTGREREICELIVSGVANKAIAIDLDISVRTVESHRARIMEKLQARTLVDLVLLSVARKAANQGRRD